MREYVINWYRVACGGWFFYLENAHFGWNRSPQSAEELICDGIVLVILAMAVSSERIS